MNLQDLKAFVAVAETGSIGRAARHLNLTQPATTRRVQNFEAALGGAALLDRRAKPPTLTPAGRQALEHCRRVLKAVAELAATAGAAGQPTGELRIGIAHGMAEYVITAPLDAVRRKYPALRLQVTSNWTTRLIEDIRTGALDCAVGLIVAGHSLPPAVQATSLGGEEIVIVAKRDTVRRKPKKGTGRLRDLAGNGGAEGGWVLNPAGCGCRAALQRAFDGARLPMQVAAEVFGEDLQLSMLAHGGSGGYGLVPKRQFMHSAQRRHLRIVKVLDFELSATIALLHGPALGSRAPAVDLLRTQIARQVKRS